MASEYLTATLRHEWAQEGQSWSGLIDGDVGGRLDAVKFGTACNVGFGPLTASVLPRDGAISDDGRPLIPDGEAASILHAWWLGVLRVYMRGEAAYVGRVKRIELGELVDDPRLGPSRTVDIECRGIAHDLARRRASVPGRFTDEKASTTVADIIEEAIEKQGGIIAANFDRIANATIDAGQLSPQLGDYWLDIIVRACGVNRAFLVFEPEAGPMLIERGQPPARWRYPALGSGVGIVRDDDAYTSDVIVNYSDAAHSNQATEPIYDDEVLLLNHNIPFERTINVDGTSRAGAEEAGREHLALHGFSVGPTGQLTIEPTDAPYAMVPNAEGGMEPSWRVRAGDTLDLFGLLPNESRWRAMRLFNVESTEYDDAAGTLRVTLDDRRVRLRAAEDSVSIRLDHAALSPSRPRGTVAMWETTDTTYAVQGSAEVVDTIGDEGLMVLTLPMATEVKIHYYGLFVPSATSGRLTLGIDIDNEGFNENLDFDRLARSDVTSTTRKSVEGLYRRYLPAGEHIVRLWAERASGLSGTTLEYGRVSWEG